jgi:hypothetical protein
MKIPIVFLLLFFALKYFNTEFYYSLLVEDGFLEWMQCLLYLAAGVIFLTAFWRTRKKNLRRGLLYLIYSLALIFVAGEEISWGQRILNFSNPEYFEQNNNQGEFTLHNLDPVQGKLHDAYILVGLGGASSHLVLGSNRFIPVPPKATMHYFWPIAVYYYFVDYVKEPLALGFMNLPEEWPLGFGANTVTWLRTHPYAFTEWLSSRDQELFETTLAMGALAFAWQDRKRRITLS